MSRHHWQMDAICDSPPIIAAAAENSRACAKVRLLLGFMRARHRSRCVACLSFSRCCIVTQVSDRGHTRQYGRLKDQAPVDMRAENRWPECKLRVGFRVKHEFPAQVQVTFTYRMPARSITKSTTITPMKTSMRTVPHCPRSWSSVNTFSAGPLAMIRPLPAAEPLCQNCWLYSNSISTMRTRQRQVSYS
jgi:hypothetical protein